MRGPASDARLLHAQAWAKFAGPLDRQLEPLGRRAIQALSPMPGDVVVDVGCGAGATALQLADLVGEAGQVIGVDIAPLLLDLARRRTAARPQVSFIEGDAQTLDRPPMSVDGVFSRFGVMSFVDPAAAFTNFRRLLKPSGRLAFVCWRSLGENELDLLPLCAAGLEGMADPAPFQFADREHVRAILEAAGFVRITIQPHDDMVSCGGLEATLAVLLSVGALGRIMRERPELRATAEPRLRSVLAERGVGADIALRAATWVVAARP